MPGARAKLTAPALTGALVALVVAAGQAGASTSPFHSSIITGQASHATCTAPTSQPYSAFGDLRSYVPAPGGAFDGALEAGWQLSGGAYLATDEVRGSGLALPAGASAISPAVCVDLDFPHLRLAHRVVGAAAGNLELHVEVVYPDAPDPEWTEVKAFDGAQGQDAGDGWRISPDIDLKPDFGGQAAGARYVALRLTAVDKTAASVSEDDEDADSVSSAAVSQGELRIDDVFVDPRMRM